jgi:Leucine-rich repeat (LRR) protein
MTGPLPLTLQHSTSVSSVHLTSNAFEGLLTFPNASNLTQLYVSKNKFTDLAINANQALLKAALDDNQFNCTLPDLQGFPSLQVLSVARNQFQGSIPNVTGLRQLLKL